MLIPPKFFEQKLSLLLRFLSGFLLFLTLVYFLTLFLLHYDEFITLKYKLLEIRINEIDSLITLFLLFCPLFLIILDSKTLFSLMLYSMSEKTQTVIHLNYSLAILNKGFNLILNFFMNNSG